MSRPRCRYYLRHEDEVIAEHIKISTLDLKLTSVLVSFKVIIVLCYNYINLTEITISVQLELDMEGFVLFKPPLHGPTWYNMKVSV